MGLIAKGTVGALAAATAIGTGIAAQKNDWFGSSKPFVEEDLTKFDKGLIDFLETGGEIEFEVKKGNEDFSENDLSFTSSSTFPLTAKVSVLVGHGKEKLIEKRGNTKDEGKRLTLQQKNGTNGLGTEWTWSCEITFKSGETFSEEKSINNKDKIFNSTNNGLFNLLKKDLSTSGTEEEKKEAKDAKEKFIGLCANARDNTTIKTQETLTNNKLESSITINLKSGVAGQGDKTDTSKLYPSGEKNDEKFSELFG